MRVTDWAVGVAGLVSITLLAFWYLFVVAGLALGF